jgi:hypothetical protein
MVVLSIQLFQHILYLRNMFTHQLLLPYIHFQLYYLGILQQPGEAFTRPQPEHLVWFGLQHKAVPSIWPHLVQIAAVLASFGILQQPGEPFTRLQPEHLVWFGLQHKVEPFI